MIRLVVIDLDPADRIFDTAPSTSNAARSGRSTAGQSRKSPTNCPARHRNWSWRKVARAIALQNYDLASACL
jgi:hypothetical protein